MSKKYFIPHTCTAREWRWPADDQLINPTYAKYENVRHCLAIGVQGFKSYAE